MEREKKKMKTMQLHNPKSATKPKPKKAANKATTKKATAKSTAARKPNGVSPKMALALISQGKALGRAQAAANGTTTKPKKAANKATGAKAKAKNGGGKGNWFMRKLPNGIRNMNLTQTGEVALKGFVGGGSAKLIGAGLLAVGDYVAPQVTANKYASPVATGVSAMIAPELIGLLFWGDTQSKSYMRWGGLIFAAGELANAVFNGDKITELSNKIRNTIAEKTGGTVQTRTGLSTAATAAEAARNAVSEQLVKSGIEKTQADMIAAHAFQGTLRGFAGLDNWNGAQGNAGGNVSTMAGRSLASRLAANGAGG